MAIKKIKLPNNTTVDVQDARIPAPTSADSGKVLGVTNTSGTLGWVNQSGGTEVEANPTVPSGTTPTALTGLKIDTSYYSIAASAIPMTNNEIDTAVNTAWV